MKKWTILFMVLLALKALCQCEAIYMSEWEGIDCGSETSYDVGNFMTWQSDAGFIKTGKNKQVSLGNYTSWVQLNTLRVFTEQKKNCYTLSTETLTSRYFFRVVFHYGNFDGLSKPPTFDLLLDGSKLATVVTSMTGPVYYEVIYPSRREKTSVCLVRTQDEQFPFISSLEKWELPDEMYPGMSRDLAWLISNGYRYDYGAKDWILGYPADDYNRLWEPMTPSGLDVVTADFTYLYCSLSESPPDSVMFQAIEAPSPSDTIALPFTISKANGLNYVVAYFTEVAHLDETRSFDFYVNDKFVSPISLQYQECTDASANAQSASTFNIELRPNASSSSPSIINAVEVYRASDPLVIMTSQDDWDGLAAFTSTFGQLEGWSGDPCLPSDTAWEWVNCTGDDPPRVTSINLPGYGLDGPLPDFSTMQALETIDLGYNSLDGPIPDFLGNLPNLKLLILRHNNFSGEVPRSIIDNKQLKYDIRENPGLGGVPNRKGKNIALKIGLAVGVSIGLLVVIACVRDDRGQILIVTIFYRKEQIITR